MQVTGTEGRQILLSQQFLADLSFRPKGRFGKMFTGLVQSKGVVQSGVDGRFAFLWPHLDREYQQGESIAVNGCCLTVVSSKGEVFYADVVGETLSRTNLGNLQVGQEVNLERPMAASDVFGGHIVLGHVDCTGTVATISPKLRIDFDNHYDLFLAEKGSICIDGVSLTVADVGSGWVEVAIIPHTSDVTTLGQKSAGSIVNLEFDIIAKHVARLAQHYLGRDES